MIPVVEPCDAGVTVKFGADVFELDPSEASTLLNELTQYASTECASCGGNGGPGPYTCPTCEGTGWTR